MTWAFPQAAWFLLLALPILAFYLLRERAQRRSVSTLLFWMQAPAQVHSQPLFRRLRRVLSYLLQIFFLALLVFALADLAQDQSGTPTVFVLDQSSSMEATTEDDQSARALALEALRNDIHALPAEAPAVLLATGVTPQVVTPWTTRHSTLLNALDTLAADPLIADSHSPSETLRLARSLAAARGEEGAEVRFYTDGVFAGESNGMMEGIKAVVVAPEPENVGITLFAARRLTTNPSTVVLRLQLTSAAELWEGVWQLYRDEQLIEARTVAVQAGETETVVWQDNTLAGHDYRVVLETPAGDSFSRDNSAELQLEPLTPVAVQLVGAPNFFLESAFQARAGVTVTLRDTVPASWTPMATEEAVLTEPGQPAVQRLWVFDRIAPEPSFFAAAQAAGEAVVLLDPRSDGPWGSYRERLDDVVIAQMTEASERPESPLQHVDFGRVTLLEAGAYEPPAGVQTWVEADSTPLAFGVWDDAEEWLVLGFSLERSDLALRAALPILAGNVVQLSRGGDLSALANLPGPVESALQAQLPTTLETVGPVSSSWAGIPWWWFALLVGLLWCLGEWWSWSRRWTE